MRESNGKKMVLNNNEIFLFRNMSNSFKDVWLDNYTIKDNAKQTSTVYWHLRFVKYALMNTDIPTFNILNCNIKDTLLKGVYNRNFFSNDEFFGDLTKKIINRI